jgi:ABC-type sulfate/molybdate transport systems ATPase subunit
VFKGVSVRPHDLELSRPSEGAIEGSVQAVMELGFEVQVTVALSDGTTPWVQMSRNEFRTLNVEVGSPISVRERVIS